jgi:hypothetical protein
VIRCGLAEMQPDRPACCREVGTKPALRDTEERRRDTEERRDGEASCNLAAMHNEVGESGSGSLPGPVVLRH